MSQYMTKQFENRLVTHVKICFSKEFESLGESEARSWIAHGIAKARGYGIITENHICKYINIMFAFFNKAFDTSVELPWAQEILNNSSLKNSFSKTGELVRKAELEFSAAMESRNRIASPA